MSHPVDRRSGHRSHERPAGYDGPRSGYDGPTAGYDSPRSGFDGPNDGYDPAHGYDRPRQYDGPGIDVPELPGKRTRSV